MKTLNFNQFNYIHIVLESELLDEIDRSGEWGAAATGAAAAAGATIAGVAATYFLARRAVMQRKIKNLVKERTKLEDKIIDLGGSENKDKRKAIRTRTELIDERLEAILSAYGSKMNGLADYRELQLTKMRLKLNAKRMKMIEKSKDLERFNRLKDQQKKNAEKASRLDSEYKRKFREQEDSADDDE
jgi:uncharacterized membrane protein YhiD involved in acid resistance